MKQFLIADDSPVIRKVARRIIEDFGFQVSEAENGEHARQLCAETMPDAVLIDWQMPGLSGLDLIEWLAAKPEDERPKIIFCTSEVLVPVMTKAKRAGAGGFLLKPFSRHSIARTLAEMGLIEGDRFAA